MAAERLNRNFQAFLQSIYHWPSPTIEKTILIGKLEALCRQNPELEHIYENVPLLSNMDPPLNEDTVDQSSLNLTENYFSPPTIQNDVKKVENYVNPPAVQNNVKQSNNNNLRLNNNDKLSIKKESNLLLNTILVKEGDLSIRKGSTILSPLIKKSGLKSTVYCELSYTYWEGEKLVYLVLYQSRKCRKIVYKFLIDETCSVVYQSKRDFQFKHNAVAENFTTETGVANTWIAAFNETSLRDTIDEDVYENPDDLSPASELPQVEMSLETPTRPPPRPDLPTNPISPENIYVCLYDHYSTSNDPHELEFSCGDLLYIINADGPDFYIGHRLILPLNSHSSPPIGLVFKDYIKPAYEKVF